MQIIQSFVYLLCSSLLVAQPTKPAINAALLLDDPLEPGVTSVWSPTGQASWDMLRVYHGVKTIDFDRPTATSVTLNKFEWNALTTLPSGSYIFGGDYTDQAVATVKAKLLTLAGKPAADMIDPPPPLGLLPNTVPPTFRIKSALMVSCLVAKPRFPGAFVPTGEPRLFTLSNGKSVSTHGFQTSGEHAEGMGDNVTVLADDLAGSVVLSFVLLDPKTHEIHRLVLATKAHMGSLSEGIAFVREHMKKPLDNDTVVTGLGRQWLYKTAFTKLDSFWMPELSCHVLCDYGELIGGTYLRQPGPNGSTLFWRIAQASQMLSFRLNHEGALVESVFKVPSDFVSMAGSDAGQGMPKPKNQEPPVWPKHFSLNKPFLATLWLKDAEWPYLALWVDSAEALAK